MAMLAIQVRTMGLAALLISLAQANCIVVRPIRFLALKVEWLWDFSAWIVQILFCALNTEGFEWSVGGEGGCDIPQCGADVQT